MRKFETLKGFLKSNKDAYISIESVLDGRGCFETKEGYVFDNFKLSNDALKELADGFSKYLYSTKEKADKVSYGIMNHLGDHSYLQCFYISLGREGVRYSNSLSGEAFNYCRRKFKASI